MAAYVPKNHPSVQHVQRLADGSFFVQKQGRGTFPQPVFADRPVERIRTMTKDGKRPLAKPVREIVTENVQVGHVDVPYSTINGMIVKRRKTLRKLGVKVIP